VVVRVPSTFVEGMTVRVGEAPAGPPPTAALGKTGS
jgi:hypothetical protein